ncbi:MAG: DUF4157 domain-containing protein [Synechococcaceae cyanobacterium]
MADKGWARQHSPAAEQGRQQRPSARRGGGRAMERDQRSEMAKLQQLRALANDSQRVQQLRRLQALAQGPERSAEAEPTATQAEIAKPKPNLTGLPDRLKSNLEALSGLSMEAVRVHYNSTKPAQLNALAYAQGTDIHLGPGQEQHLPHEAWHVVQQAQGRVRPTMQMAGGVAVNDDKGLEREADVMGGRAVSDSGGLEKCLSPVTDPGETHLLAWARLSLRLRKERFLRCPSVLERRPFPSHQSTSPVSNDITQRKLRIGKNYEFLGEKNKIPKDIKAGVSATEVLVKMKADNIVYGFDSMDTLKKFVAAVDAVNGSSDLIKRVLDDPMFVSWFAQEDKQFHLKLNDWMWAQMRDLKRTVYDPELEKQFEAFGKAKSEIPTLESALRTLVLAFKQLVKFQTQSFVLNESRTMDKKNGDGSICSQKYGYHLTKLHNLKGIRAMGLQPTEGAGPAGSLAMSTLDQKKGSEQTSKGMIAYGLHPETFRPYINQAEDRRQMIKNQPIEMKPVMLRFLITDPVRERAINLLSDGKHDYMDKTAFNSDIPVLPDLIEVLTPNGFVPIRNYNHMQPNQILALRSEGDDARMNVPWTGKMAVFNYEQLSKVEKLKELLGFDKKPETPFDYANEVKRLNKLRDVKSINIAGISYVFRGGTFQTSGNPKNWQYAFSVDPKNGLIPEWLDKLIRDYDANFQKPANSLIDRLRKEYKQVEAPRIELAALQDQFEIGKSSGTDLTCLLVAIDQLQNKNKEHDPSRVAAMSKVLENAGYAPKAEIDIYSGAGMQLANDLKVRLKVHQQIGTLYVQHPILGVRGPILHILHRMRTFDPLWPKQKGS